VESWDSLSRWERSELGRDLRRAEIERIRTEARAGVRTLVDDPFWVAGLVLYWAEGAKTKNQLSMANTDARALRLFIRWVRTYLMRDARFSMLLHLHEGNDEAAAKLHWRRETGLWEANYHKSFIKPSGTGHRKNHLPHGVCTVRVRRCADAWNIVMAWIDGFGEQFHLERHGE
jgi:hypothetical protein